MNFENLSIDTDRWRDSGKKKRSRGQALIEYVLLLVVATSMALLLIRSFILKGDSPEESGILIKRWSKIQEKIGSDSPAK